MTYKLLSPNDFGAKLVELRTARGWKQVEFARRLGKTQPEVSRWEAGGVAPSYSTVAMLAEALGVNVEAFMAVGNTSGSAADSPEWSGDRWDQELRNAGLRAEALLQLATAERVHAEASRARAEAEKVRAEALAAQSRATEQDSDRANRAQSLEERRYEVRAERLTDAQAASIRDRREAEAAVAATPPEGQTPKPKEEAG